DRSQETRNRRIGRGCNPSARAADHVAESRRRALAAGNNQKSGPQRALSIEKEGPHRWNATRPLLRVSPNPAMRQGRTSREALSRRIGFGVPFTVPASLEDPAFD